MSDPRFFDMFGPITIKDLAARLGLSDPVVNIGDEQITGFAPLAISKPGQISFLSNRKNLPDLETGRASACFVTDKFSEAVTKAGIAPLICASPRQTLAAAIPMLFSPKGWFSGGAPAVISKSAKIHDTATICAGAKIGDDVVIGPYCYIGPGTVIGAGTVLDSHISVECAEIGKNCRVKAGARIGGSGFGMEPGEDTVSELPHIGRVIIGDNVWIGNQTCIDRGFLGDTIIGPDVKIDNLVQVAHNVKIGRGSIIAGRSGISGSVDIGENVMLGGGVGLSDHIKIGDKVQLAASSGVMHDIPAGEIWAGTPAMPFRDFMKMTASVRKMTLKKKG